VNPLICGSGRQRHIQCAGKGLGAPHLIDESGAGIEGVPVLVEGDAEHIRIVPEDLLGAVAVVHIGIDDGNPLVAVPGPKIIDQDRHVVDVAEAPVAVHHPHAVVAWRPDQGEAIPDLPPLEGIGQGEGAARSDEVGLGHLALHVGNAEVCPGYILLFSRAGLVLLYAGKVHQPLLEYLVTGVEQPLLPLRVGGAYGPVECREEYQPGLSVAGHLSASPRMEEGRQ